jgi:hypothetical protein
MAILSELNQRVFIFTKNIILLSNNLLKKTLNSILQKNENHWLFVI